MKSMLLKSKSFYMIMLFLVSSNCCFSQKVADFSGEWILNKSQSKSIPSSLSSASISISQNGFSLTMDVTLKTENRTPINRTEKYLLNSSVAYEVTKTDDKSTRIDASLARDGQSFTITETITFVKDGSVNKSQRIDTYSISKDGKTLTINTVDILPEGSATPKGDLNQTRVYDKK